jgi:tetratricopeptide (TPR) repeat protein
MYSTISKTALLLGGFLLTVTFQGWLPSSGAQARAETWLARGDSAYLTFDNETALRFYTQALEADSHDFDIRLQLSRTQYDLGLDRMAQDERDAALALFNESVRHADWLVTTFPESPQAHFLYAATMGNMALFKGGREKVEIGRIVELHSRRAIELDSTFSYPYVSLGIYHRELSQLNWIERTLVRVLYGHLPEASLTSAVAYLEHAKELRPEFPFLHHELAKTYDVLKQKDKVMEHLRILVELEPETTQDIRNQEKAQQLIGTSSLTASDEN